MTQEDTLKKRLAILVLLTLLPCHFVCSQTKTSDAVAHTPAKGSPERQAILDALRGDSRDVLYQVHYVKVHNGWCWIDTTPQDKQGHATAEGGPNLVHFEGGTWKVMDLSTVAADPKDPLGDMDASPGYIKNLLKVFPGVPRDIFPKPSN